jgi:hypothetical protein
MKYQLINNIEFKTVSSLTNYTRTLLKELGICESVKETNINTFNFLFELIKNHPSYDERIKDFDDFVINYNEKNKKALELFIKKDNGDCESISWMCCCSGKPRTDKDLFNKCLREIIKQQIYEFKNKNKSSICELCKKHSDNIHIDHYKTTFKQIVDNFLTKYKLKIPSAYEKDGSNNVIMLGDDVYIGELFETYHKQVATFRILCAKCNMSRGKDGTDVEIYDIVEKKNEIWYLREYVIDLD